MKNGPKEPEKKRFTPENTSTISAVKLGKILTGKEYRDQAEATRKIIEILLRRKII